MTRVVSTVLLALAIAILVLPIAFLGIVSLKGQADIASGTILPHELFWQNWPDAFASIAIGTYLRNSLVASVASAALTLAIAVPGTHAIIRHGLGGTALPALILGSYMAPPIVALFPLFYLLKLLGLVNSVAGLALIYGVMNLPVAFWLLSSFVRRLPVELEEAAVVDGAGPLTVLVRIVLPLLMPGIVGTAIICAILAYNEFLLAAFLTRSEATQTLPVGLSLYQGDRQLRYGQMAVASLVGIAPVYLLAMFLQRWLVRGLTAGAIK